MVIYITSIIKKTIKKKSLNLKVDYFDSNFCFLILDELYLYNEILTSDVIFFYCNTILNLSKYYTFFYLC